MCRAHDAEIHQTGQAPTDHADEIDGDAGDTEHWNSTAMPQTKIYIFNSFARDRTTLVLVSQPLTLHGAARQSTQYSDCRRGDEIAGCFNVCVASEITCRRLLVYRSCFFAIFRKQEDNAAAL